MTLDLVLRTIQDFLRTDTPEILAIKGDWGVGKTYQWKQIQTEAAKQGSKSMALDHYSYVSLFGVNSVDDLKLAIFSNKVPRGSIGMDRDIWRDHWLDYFRKMQAPVLSRIKEGASWGRHLLRESPWKGFSPLIESVLMSLSLRETLVCLDDIERVGPKLTSAEILGLANSLKEDKQCKIVLIYNEREIEENETFREGFMKFREKVIDTELTFEPSPQECLDIAIPGTDQVSTYLKAFILRLKINNIRIIRKIDKMARLMWTHLQNVDASVAEHALRSLVLFTASRFRAFSVTTIPNLGFIKSFDPYDALRPMWKKEDDEDHTETEDDIQQHRWISVLMEYGFWGCSEFDLEIAKLVEHGYVDDDSFLQQAKQLQENAEMLKAGQNFSNAWKFCMGSFDDNLEEVVQTISQCVKDNVKFLNLFDLDAAVRALRRLNRDALADELIDDYVRLRADFLLTQEKGHLWRALKDDLLREAVTKAIESQAGAKSLEEILAKIEREGNWHANDVKFLSGVRVTDYYKLFKKVQDPELMAYIKICLYDDLPPQINESASEALRQIRRENDLNALRLKYMGIDLTE